jgi:5-methylcytosine-specific restriction endonuclease McrA
MEFRGLDVTNPICKICLTELPPRGVGNPRLYCSTKCKEKARPKTEKRRNQKRESYKNHYQKNKTSILEKNKKWFSSNPGRHRGYISKYKETNADMLRRKARQYAQENRDKRIEYKKQYRERFPEKNQQWVKENLEKVRLNARRGNHKRRSNKARNGGSFTSTEWLDLLNRYEHKCLCCGEKNIVLSIDHVIPISKGGINSIENIQPLCSSCNSRKGNKTIDYRIARTA